MYPTRTTALRSAILLAIACLLTAATARASSGDLLVSDYSGDDIRLYSGQYGDDLGEFVSAGNGGLNGTWDATFGPDGNLYVASSITNSVLRYDGATGEFIDVFASGGGLSGPVGIVFGPDGNMYVSGAGNDCILRYDGATGAFMDVFTSGAPLGVPRGLQFGPDGNLYVTHFGNNVVRYDGQSGAFIDSFVASGSGGLDSPADLVFGPDGYLYVASRDSGAILRYDGMTGDFVDAFAFAGIPIGLAFGSDGDLYVSDIATGARHVVRFDGQTGALIEVFASGLITPTFLTFVPDDDQGEEEEEGTDVCICHIPPGKPENAHTICVAEAAVPAHLAHGDLPHPCAGDDGPQGSAGGKRGGSGVDADEDKAGSGIVKDAAALRRR